MVAVNVNSHTAVQDKDYWATPDGIVKGSLEYFKWKGFIPSHATIGLDVCASKHNTKHPTNFITEKEDSLSVRWKDRLPLDSCVAWCNPPYSRGSKELFIAKAIQEAHIGVETIMLLPNDTSAKWFSACVKNAKAVAFICDGRIGFINNATGERVNGNNAGSILVLFGARESKVARTLYVTKQRLEELGNETI